MGYYRAGGAGDYYQGKGDYYRGDPFLGLLAPVAGGLIKRGISALISRAGARGAAGAAGAIAAGATAVGAARRLTSSGGTIFAPAPPSRGITVRPGAILPGGRPFISQGEMPRGYHAAKDGSGRIVRNRHMNVTNPAALRRAIRRQDGFVGLAKRMGMVMRPGPSKVLKPRGKKR